MHERRHGVYMPGLEIDEARDVKMRFQALPAPNPRLQRTRSRSPLSRQPLGRGSVTLVLVVAATCLAACEYSGRASLDPATRLAKSESDVARARGGYERWIALDDASLLNAEVGSVTKAKAYAEELLTTAPKYLEDWNYGNAIHKGNLTLGLVSLKRGDLKAAEERLLAAGRTRGSPQLDSFGPNMVLAKALVEAGERDAVVAYFDLCAKFWKMDYGKLEQWKERVRSGAVPDFGANLYY